MKGLIGVGMPIVAVPMLALFIDLRPAVALLTVPLFLSKIPQALEGGGVAVALRAMLPIFCGCIPGLVAGVAILVHADPHVAKGIGGAALVLVASLLLLAPKFKIPRGRDRVWGVAVGLMAGVMGWVAAISGPLVFAFLIANGARGKAFTQQASLFIVISSAALAVALSGNRAIVWQDVVISAIAMLPVGLGMLFGQRLRDRLQPETFRRFVLIAILAGGIDLLRRSFLTSWRRSVRCLGRPALYPVLGPGHAKVLAQSPALVRGAVQAAPLHLRHHHVHEFGKPAR